MNIYTPRETVSVTWCRRKKTVALLLKHASYINCTPWVKGTSTKCKMTISLTKSSGSLWTLLDFCLRIYLDFCYPLKDSYWINWLSYNRSHTTLCEFLIRPRDWSLKSPILHRKLAKTNVVERCNCVRRQYTYRFYHIDELNLGRRGGYRGQGLHLSQSQI